MCFKKYCRSKSYKMWVWVLINLLVSCGCSRVSRLDLEGPELVTQPASVTYFSNSFGLTLECQVRGYPPIKTTFLTSDGRLATEIPGIREISGNGSLHILPFRGEDYMPSVHNEKYRCSVTNPVGTTLSSIFATHAVIDEPFEIFINSVTDENEIINENPVLLKCDTNLPLYKDFLKTIHWRSIDQYGHETEIESDGTTYQISSAGSLLILTAKYQQLFICVAQNTLNKRIQSSPPFLVKSRAGVGELEPKSVGKWERVILTEIGKSIDLLCLSGGNPSPYFRWEKFFNGRFLPVISVDPKGKIFNPLLSFHHVTTFQNGTYNCETFNQFGNLSMQLDLIITGPPRVEIQPKKQNVNLGQNVELECKTPDVSSHAEITWLHNGKELQNVDTRHSARIKLSLRRLSIFNIRYEDQGVYQCFIQIGKYHVGGTSHIVFQPSEPELIHTFISQTIQPSSFLSLKCSATGNPMPVLSWMKDGIELDPSRDPRLTITNADGKNTFGAFDSKTTWLREPGQNALRDEFVGGKPLSLSDDPSLSMWKEYNHRYSAGNHLQLNEIVSHLNISSIRVQDSGFYQCIASNLFSTSTHVSRIDVYGKLFVKDLGQMTKAAGQVTLIPCPYGGYPVDKVVWTHNGSDIDPNKYKNQFKILNNKTLQIEKIQAGQYSCTVSNSRGERASGSVSINVLRPPVISPFSFDDNLQEGQRCSLSCNVISGDFPINFIWLKDDQPIPPNLNITQMRVKFLSSLIFEDLKKDHSGFYTCTARNSAAADTYSYQLNVKVPPKWLHEPQNTRAFRGSELMVPCRATGFPTPTTKWVREFNGMRTAIRADQKFQISENGSLQILNMESKDASNYTCEASNGVANGIQKSIQISIIIPAEVAAPLKSIVVAEGFPATLRCHIYGDRPIQVVWRGPKNQLELGSVIEINSTMLSAELKIDSSESSGRYLCLASNQYGHSQDAISVTFIARPRPPQDLIVEKIESRLIRLKWSSNTENLSTDPVTHFLLQYKNSSDISWDSDGVQNITVQAQTPSNEAILRSLSPVTHYEIRIIALNEIGRSLPNQPISVSTLAEAPSGPPLNITAISTSSKTVLVTWESPKASLQNGAIMGYHVLVSAASINVLPNSSLVIDEKWGHQTEINELKPNSRYRISIRAYNTAGLGPESPFITIITPEGAPDSAPLNVICEPLSPKSLQILWAAPPHQLSNGVIQGYKVIYSPVHAELQGEKAEVKKTINRETTLHGLQSYTNYSIRTLAYTLGGESSPSDPVFCTTEEDLPEEPAAIKVLPSGSNSNSVSISWLPPKNPNGIIKNYRITWTSEDGIRKEKLYVPEVGDDQMHWELRRLNSKRYTISISAATSVGLGNALVSHEIFISNGNAPAKIASFPVMRRPKLEQSVMLPCKGVGYPLPQIIFIREPGQHSLNPNMRNGSFFIPRVKEQDEGIYFCKAENSGGSDEIQHQISISRAPSSVSVALGYISTNSIQIHWDPPSQADPPLTGYILQYKTGSFLEWTLKRLGSRLTSFAMENLRCGTSYHIKLVAENSIGMGESSLILKTKTNGGPPDYPKLTEVIDGNGTMIRIDLSRWPDGGCPVKKFHLEYKSKSSYEWNPIHRINSSRVFILNTTLGTKYDFRISLENEAGLISKTFSVESSPQFFTNYDKLMQSEENRGISGGISIFKDPHIIVPIISALICTTAVIICILIVVKRKTAPREGWKLGNSSSQQTWLSSEDFRVEKAVDKSKIEEVAGNSAMSIYATLNSRKQIPMTIRDSTVRFQTFGQVENYEAPPMQSYTKTRGISNASLSHPAHDELIMQEGFVINRQKLREQQELATYRNSRRISNSNEYSIEDICHDYASPYQVVPVNRESEPCLRNTLRKQHKQGKRLSRGYMDQVD